MEIQVVAMRVFFIPIISQKISVFRPVDVSMIFRRFPRFVTKNDFFQKCPRSVWEWSGGIPDLFRAIFDPFRETNRKSPKMNNYENPYKNQVNFVAPCRSNIADYWPTSASLDILLAFLCAFPEGPHLWRLEWPGWSRYSIPGWDLKA